MAMTLARGFPESMNGKMQSTFIADERTVGRTELTVCSSAYLLVLQPRAPSDTLLQNEVKCLRDIRYC